MTTTNTFKFKIGDKVGIAQLRNIFSREYDEKWSGELFNISSRFWRNNTPIYDIKDYNGEEITGTFYQSELQKIDIKDEELWKIEKILKTNGKGHNKQLYVKWLTILKKKAFFWTHFKYTGNIFVYLNISLFFVVLKVKYLNIQKYFFIIFILKTKKFTGLDY